MVRYSPASLPTMLAGLFLLRFELHSIRFTTALRAWYSSPYASNFTSFIFNESYYYRELSTPVGGGLHLLKTIRDFDWQQNNPSPFFEIQLSNIAIV